MGNSSWSKQRERESCAWSGGKTANRREFMTTCMWSVVCSSLAAGSVNFDWRKMKPAASESIAKKRRKHGADASDVSELHYVNFVRSLNDADFEDIKTPHSKTFPSSFRHTRPAKISILWHFPDSSRVSWSFFSLFQTVVHPTGISRAVPHHHL